MSKRFQTLPWQRYIPHLFTVASSLFVAYLIVPYLFSSGLPVTYDLATHYHMSYRMARGLWDPTWSAGVTTIDYPPGALLPAIEFTSALNLVFSDPYLGFKIFYFFVFIASIGAVWLLSKTFDPSPSRAATCLLLVVTSPALARALFAGWLTVMTAFLFMTLGYSFFHRFRLRRRLRTGFAAGLLFALASAAHPYGILVSLVLIIPALIWDALIVNFKRLRQLGPSLPLRPYFSVLAGLSFAGPALIPFFLFVRATGSEAPIPHFSRNGSLLDVVNFNILQPLGPLLIVIMFTGSVLFVTRWRRFVFQGNLSGFIPYAVYCAILLWIAAAPQGGLDSVIPFANWLVYDVFVMFVLPFAIIYASGFLKNAIRSNHPVARRFSIPAIILVAIIAIPIGFLPVFPPPFGLSVGSTYKLPTGLSNYLSDQIAQGQWGRVLALGLSTNIYDLPEISNIPLLDNNYPTGRLQDFLRSSGIDDFNTAKNYMNGTQVVQYVIANYDLFGIKWILVADPYYDQFIPQGIFHLTTFNYSYNNPPLDARLYQASPLITPFDGAVNATYRNITYHPLQSSQSLQLSGSAQTGAVGNLTNGGIRMSITTNSNGNGSGNLTFQSDQFSVAKGTTLMLELRSQNSSLFDLSYRGQSGSIVPIANLFPLTSSWQWLKFLLPNDTTISSISIGVMGNRTEESIDVGAMATGYPAVQVTNNPDGITVNRELTPDADFLIKESFFSLWKTDSAQLYQDTGGMIGLHIPQGVMTVTISMDPTLFLLQFWYPNLLILITAAYGTIAFRRRIKRGLSETLQLVKTGSQRKRARGE